MKNFEKLKPLVESLPEKTTESFHLSFKRITEIPISDKPSPYKNHYFNKDPR